MAKNSLFKMLSLDKVMKKLKFLSKPNNINKVLILVAVLLVLYMVHSKYLAKEGFASSPETLESDLGEGKTLVMFYADWCGHCKKLKPVWDETSTEVNEGSSGAKMLKVDCGKPNEEPSHKAIMEKYGIQGYPTIKVFENGSHSEYEGARTKEGLIGFLNA